MAAQKPTPWSNTEVHDFLCVLAKDNIQSDLDGSTRNEKVFKEISELMATRGYRRTSKQCREKLKKLKCDYRTVKEHNGKRGANRKTWKWFVQMDAIYGDRPANNGSKSGLDTASELLEVESTMDDDCVQLSASMERSGLVGRGVTRWSHRETQALLAAWSEDGIQRELEESHRNEAIFEEISAQLAVAGVSRSANQCRNKMKKLKQEYRQLKQQLISDETMTSETLEWFYAMDSVIRDRPAAAADNTDQMTLELMISDVKTDSPSATNSTSSSATSSSSLFGRKEDMSASNWSKKEVLVLLTHWANPSVQQELQECKRYSAMCTSISAKLATLGFSKTAQNCQEKLRNLKQTYRRIKRSNPLAGEKKMWFNIMDRVLSSECAETATSSSTEPTLPVVLGLNTNDEADWLPDEVQVLVTLWAQPNIQKQLHASGTHSVFTYLSSELALIGFDKTPQQCSLKVNRLKEMYKTIKRVEPHRNNGSDWFVIMDGVLCPEAAASKDANSAAAVIAPESAEDSSQPAWMPEEVDALLTLWAEENVQERLKSTEGDERLYAQLSSELATQGFDKTTNQCRTKIRLLEQEYERFKKEKDSEAQKSSWFVMMDRIRGCPKPNAETNLAAEPLQASHPAEGCRLSVPSLCLLVPTLRLMCAFAWQVVRCRNVAQYNKVEELVSLVTELAPELLTARERAQLLLRLRARLVLELCRSESVADLLDVQSHLRIIQELMMSSGCDQEELEKSKSNFVEVVHTLLDDPQERRRFFMEVFPIHYGQQYEAALQTLVWKFISRLDNLLPVPDIKQTADWLSSAPSVMEECGQLVLEREQLKELLHFNEQQTNTNKCFSEAQNVFLPLLHLRPKTNSRQRAASVGENEGFDCGKDKEALDESLTDDTTEDSGTRHNQSLKPLQPHRCSMCSYSDSQVAALLQHIRQEHLIQEYGPLTKAKYDVLKDIVTPDSHGPPFQCDQCEKTFPSKRYLNIHYRIHTGETPFLCSICGQGFRSSFTLKTHTRTHTGERPYVCPICGKTSVQHLARHMRMHRGEKNYLCAECGKAFLSSGELRLHMRHHTGEKPYTCRQCGKGFIAKCLLTVHTRRHTGERPYRCSLCPKAFFTLREQKRHLKTHNKKVLPVLKVQKNLQARGDF